MSFDYGEMAALADEILLEFGAPVILTRTTPGAYDPATGTTGGPVSTPYTGTGAAFDYEAKDIDGTLIKAGDRRVYLSTAGIVAPRTGDTLAIAGAALTVVAVRPLQPALLAVLFDVQCRGVS